MNPNLTPEQMAEKPMTLQQAKDEIAKTNYAYKNWKDFFDENFRNPHFIIEVTSKAAELYAQVLLSAEKEKAKRLEKCLSKVLGCMALERVERFDLIEEINQALKEFNQ